jgi:broad specificity phosphatase PhoE
MSHCANILADLPWKQSEGRKRLNRLAGEPVVGLTAVYSSSSGRSMETGGPLASKKNLEIIPDPAFGEWFGERDAERQKFNDVRSGTGAPLGELMLETQARMVAGMLNISARRRGEMVAIFQPCESHSILALPAPGNPFRLFT